MAINFYELETLIRFSATFTHTASGLVVDPGAVTLWMEDPCGEETTFTFAEAEIVRINTGQYYCEFAPDQAGRWTYKWQGTPPAEVTSRDTYFIVNRSTFPV